MLLDHLAQAERHIAGGRLIIERQQALITELERDGHPTAQARALLDTFVELQRMHEDDRERIMHELAELDVRGILSSGKAWTA